ncbi:hypothetical protein TYRP_016997 [Tyrophagus putrescentiae]|nr:hypothetical protein TYRP_016997 [Tyrophagus putrescentiae]
MASKSSSFSFFSSLPTPVHLLYSAGLFFNHFAFVKQCSISRCSILNLILLLFSGHLLHGDLARPSGPGGHLRRQRGVHQPPGHLQQPGLPAGQPLGAALLQPLLQSAAGHLALVVLIALTLGLLPHYGGHLWLLFLAFTVNGFGGGSWDSSCSVWIVEKRMWSGERRSASAISALHTTYGVGSILGPLFVARYVYGTSWRGGRRDEEAVADGALCRLGGHFVDCFGRAHPPPPTKLGLTALCLAFYASAELAYINFSSTVLQMLETEGEDKISAEEAAILQSVLAAAYALGRLATAFIAIRVRPEAIMAYHYLTVLCGLLAVFFGRSHRVLVYGGTAVLGAGFSAMWPAILAFTERYMRLTHCAGTVLYFANGLLSLFSPLIVGRYLVSRPAIFFLFEGVYLLVSLLLFAVIRLGLIRKRLRFFNDERWLGVVYC